MLFVSRIRESIIVASPFLLHLFMVVAVGLYTLFGAYVMQWVENSEINRLNLENGHSTGRSKRDMGNIIVSGRELAAIAQSVHPCLINAMEGLKNLTQCKSSDLEKISIATIDDCYRRAKISFNHTDSSRAIYASQAESAGFNNKEDLENDWNFPNAVIFAFTVITTIGYGHIAPATIAGRLFCIIFGLIGIPLALLTIADIGMFLNRLVKKTVEVGDRLKRRLRRVYRRHGMRSQVSSEAGSLASSANENKGSSEGSKEQKERSGKESLTLALIFLLYLLLGSAVFSMYEVDMDFFKALYFNYVTITTIGLGDVVPKRNSYLLFTFIYITIGLALTTMAVEIAADYLKKLHYFGRKVGNVASQDVWFGGKKMKLKNLIKHLGDQLNIPVEELEHLNIDNFVTSALQVAEGQVDTLRKKDSAVGEEERPISFQAIRKEADSRNIDFVDEEKV